MPDQGEMLSALILLVMALFVASGQVPAGCWRQRLRLATLIAFALAIGAALFEIGQWLAGRSQS
jgi:hypothetical protein